MAGDLDKQRSTIGYVFTFVGAAVSWTSRKQPVVALSSNEAEYIALMEGAKELIWLQRLFGELGFKQSTFTLFSDSKSAIYLAHNSTFHSRSKHIETRFHFIRHALEEGRLKLEKIDTTVNPADMFTKVVPREKFEFCRASLGIVTT
jgi:hypothetical protein